MGVASAAREIKRLFNDCHWGFVFIKIGVGIQNKDIVIVR
jgi:hypothetical protein